MEKKDTKGEHHFMSVSRIYSSWHHSLFTLCFTCGINKGVAKRETRKAWN